MLADGKVLATGGSQVDNELTGVNNIAEIWDPATGSGRRVARRAKARLYHSTALLLPDASVLVARAARRATGPQNNLNAEIYYPPYLFTSRRARSRRGPTVANAPTSIDIGKTFRVDVAGRRRASAASRWSRPAR